MFVMAQATSPEITGFDRISSRLSHANAALLSWKVRQSNGQRANSGEKHDWNPLDGIAVRRSIRTPKLQIARIAQRPIRTRRKWYVLSLWRHRIIKLGKLHYHLAGRYEQRGKRFATHRLQFRRNGDADRSLAASTDRNRQATSTKGSKPASDQPCHGEEQQIRIPTIPNPTSISQSAV